MKKAIIVIECVVVILGMFLILGKNPGKGTSSYDEYKKTENAVSQFNSSYSLNPYVGFVLDYGADSNSNKLGFYGPEITLTKDINDYNIGIFGGSVAGLYYDYEKDNLISSLREMGLNKNIHVYSFALGGYKQPQQLFVLQYLLVQGYKLDMIINIDGFNEAALPITENYSNHISSFYPRAWNLYSVSSYDKKLTTLIGKTERLKSVRRFFGQIPLRLGYVGEIITNNLINKNQFEINKRLGEVGTSYQSKGPEPYLYSTGEEIKTNVVNTWFNSSLQTANTARANNILYFEFLQPNQYLKDTKIFSDEEIKQDVLYTSPFAAATVEMYPRIVEKVPQLKNMGVPIYDLTNIFKDTKETVYSDNCCHYNARGLDILQNNIVDIIKIYLATH